VTGSSNAVFVSYASEDAEAAQRVCDGLRAAGIEVWFDKSELRGGEAWDRQIRERVHDCRLFVALISARTESRDEGYFRREWKLAVDRTHDMSEKKAFVVPVVIDDTRERGSAVPDKFHEVQWTRLPHGETTEAFVSRIAGLIGQVPAEPKNFDVETVRTTKEKPAAARWPMAATIALATAVVIVLSYMAVNRFGAERSGTAARMAAPDKSIAVLPFVDMSEKQDQGYFADGLAEEVIDLLSKVPGLRVVGRTSSFQFRGKAIDTRSVGTALNVAYVLEGSVRRSGDRIRATAQLISTRDGTHRFSETYDAAYGDVFKVQDSIAADLARTLQVAVTSSARDDRIGSNPEAYDLFMQGRQALDSGSEDGTNKAVALFTEVVRLEPQSSRALAALAEAYADLGSEGWLLPSEAHGKARQMAEAALQLDSKNALAHAVLASVATVYEWNWQKAEREIALALELRGRDSYTLVAAAQIASAQTQWERALGYVREVLATDPLYADAHMNMGAWVYLRTGRYEAAEASIRRALQIRPRWGSGQYLLSTSLLMQGRLAEALQEAQKEQPRDGKFQATSAALYAMHRTTDSNDALRRAIEENQGDWPVSIAKLYAFRGERDQALKWLDRSYVFHDEDLYFIKGDPLLKNLEGDPRYKAFLRKMNLPE
jgi:TolB-like protein/Flp pilus assembly protein TadD